MVFSNNWRKKISFPHGKCTCSEAVIDEVMWFVVNFFWYGIDDDSLDLSGYIVQDKNKASLILFMEKVGDGNKRAKISVVYSRAIGRGVYVCKKDGAIGNGGKDYFQAEDILRELLGQVRRAEDVGGGRWAVAKERALAFVRWLCRRGGDGLFD